MVVTGVGRAAGDKDDGFCAEAEHFQPLHADVVVHDHDAAADFQCVQFFVGAASHIDEVAGQPFGRRDRGNDAVGAGGNQREADTAGQLNFATQGFVLRDGKFLDDDLIHADFAQAFLNVVGRDF